MRGASILMAESSVPSNAAASSDSEAMDGSLTAAQLSSAPAGSVVALGAPGLAWPPDPGCAPDSAWELDEEEIVSVNSAGGVAQVLKTTTTLISTKLIVRRIDGLFLFIHAKIAGNFRNFQWKFGKPEQIRRGLMWINWLSPGLV